MNLKTSSNSEILCFLQQPMAKLMFSDLATIENKEKMYTFDFLSFLSESEPVCVKLCVSVKSRAANRITLLDSGHNLLHVFLYREVNDLRGQLPVFRINVEKGRG